ncbi:MAG: ATP-binding protein [Candidatus Saccharimonadales bacterium]
MQQTLILLLGVPGAGKSTFARQLAAQINVPRISADTIRKNMFNNPREHINSADDQKVSNVMSYVVHELLAAGQSVIYDGLVEGYDKRQELYALARDRGAQCVLIEVSVAEEVAMKRLAPPEITQEYIDSYKQMIAEFMVSYEPPKNTETTVVINGDDSFEKQLEKFITANHHS